MNNEPSVPIELRRISWLTLSGPHLGFTVGSDTARRYLPGFSPIAAFADSNHPDLPSLAEFCLPGDEIYCEGWSSAPPMEWQVHREVVMIRMMWQAQIPPADDTLKAVKLGAQHVGQAVALTQLTRPGPFGPRTIELGDYFGIFEGERLVSMAGERMHAGKLREISGVCTHPEFQGRGHARGLMLKLVRLQMLRGETPMLHVTGNNLKARELYRRMGFVEADETMLRVISLR